MSGFTEHARAAAGLITLLALACAPHSLAQETTNRGEQARAIIAAFADTGQFQGSAYVTADGAVLVDEAYGVSDVTTGEPNTPDTRFYVASVTKLFTAMAILQLAEQDVLDLDTPLSRFYPDLTPDIAERVTIRLLLSHTSGLVRDHTEFLEAGESPTDAGIAIAALNRSELLFEPGTALAYSNTGYNLLAGIVEQASAANYADYLNDNVFQPAGMTGTSLHADDSAPVARGHTTRNTLDLEPSDPELATGTLPGAGGVYTTTRDLARFIDAFQHNTLLGPEFTNLMTTPALAGESDAMGLEILPVDDGVHALLASGAGEGQIAVMAWLEGADAEIIFLVNSDLLGRRGVPALFRALLMTALDMDVPPEAPDTPLRTFAQLLESDGEDTALAYAGTLNWDDAPIARAGAVQATGAPDSGPGESPLAWAPATGDAGEEWLTVRFAEPVNTSRFEIVFSQIPDAMTGVQVNSGPVVPVDVLALTRSTGLDGSPRQVIELEEAIRIESITIHLDTAATPGWPQIDAVGLSPDGGSELVWADDAVASTSAFLSSPPVIHDYPGRAHLSKLAHFMDLTGRTDLAERVRGIIPRMTH